jgi:hypothetical protein
MRTTTEARGDEPEAPGSADAETLLLIADLLGLCLRRCDPGCNSADAVETLRATLVGWADDAPPRETAHRNLLGAYDAMRKVSRDSPPGEFNRLLEASAF